MIRLLCYQFFSLIIKDSWIVMFSFSVVPGFAFVTFEDENVVDKVVETIANVLGNGQAEIDVLRFAQNVVQVLQLQF